jgi:hypothetical protein
MQLAEKQEKTSTFNTCYFDETQLAKALGVTPEDWQTLLDIAPYSSAKGLLSKGCRASAVRSQEG